MSGHTPWSEIKRKTAPAGPIATHVSRAVIETFVPTVRTVVISITDPGSPEAKIREHTLIKGIYRVPQFHDIDPEDGVLRMAHALESMDPTSYILFDDERAQNLATWIKGMVVMYEPRLILAHCEAGVFRSSAIAAAVQMHYRLEGPSAFRTGHPNRHVYRLMVKALEIASGQ